MGEAPRAARHGRSVWGGRLVTYMQSVLPWSNDSTIATEEHSLSSVVPDLKSFSSIVTIPVLVFWVGIRQMVGELAMSAVHSESYSSVSDYAVDKRPLCVLPDLRYRLHRPMLLTVYKSRDHYWASPEEFLLHGVGDTPEAAVEDYGYALLDYYEELLRLKDILAPHLMEHLEFLNSIIAKD